jgi:hypothetical protein
MNKKLAETISGMMDKQKQLLDESVRSCGQYREVLKRVEEYVDARWDPWKELVCWSR